MPDKKIFFLVHGKKSEDDRNLSEASQEKIRRFAQSIATRAMEGTCEVWSDPSLVSTQTAETVCSVFANHKLKTKRLTQEFLAFEENGYSFPKIKETAEKVDATTLIIIAPKFCIHFLPMQWGFNENSYTEGDGFGFVLFTTKRVFLF